MSDEDPTIPLKPVRDFKIKVGKFIIDRSYNSKKEAMSKPVTKEQIALMKGGIVLGIAIGLILSEIMEFLITKIWH